MNPLVLSKVFAHLDPYNRSKCRKVCSRWRDVVDGIDWPLAENFIINIDSYSNCTEKCSLTRCSKPNSYSNVENYVSIRICPNLVTIQRISEILLFTKPAYLELNGN